MSQFGELNSSANSITSTATQMASTDSVPLDVRHLFVSGWDTKILSKKIFKLQNLRTLIFDDIQPDDEVFQKIFRSFPKLWVLILRFGSHVGCHGTETFSVPECIGQLKHLRYLLINANLRGNLILPGSITKLYHIQLLEFSALFDVVFPGGTNMNHLVNLRCLRSLIDLGIPNIGRLKFLQMLPFFHAQKKQGHELRQLKDLNKLEGSLSIWNLQNVESKEEAMEACLADKERLTELRLIWKDVESCPPEVEAEVLEGLCPTKYLTILEISDYHGWAYPNWMVDKHSDGPKNLRNLWLSHCTRLQPAPQLFEVFVNLRCFRLWHSNWHTLPDTIEQLTSLLLLDLFFCLNIHSLPALPQSLEQFNLLWCNEEFMSSCETIDHPNWQKIQHIPTKVIRREKDFTLPSSKATSSGPRVEDVSSSPELQTP